MLCYYLPAGSHIYSDSSSDFCLKGKHLDHYTYRTCLSVIYSYSIFWTDHKFSSEEVVTTLSFLKNTELKSHRLCRPTKNREQEHEDQHLDDPTNEADPRSPQCARIIQGLSDRDDHRH